MHALLLLAAILAARVEQPLVVGVDQWPVPWQDTRPRDPAVDASGKVWFVGQTVFALSVMKTDTVRHMFFDAKRRELWFGTDANTIARAKVP